MTPKRKREDEEEPVEQELSEYEQQRAAMYEHEFEPFHPSSTGPADTASLTCRTASNAIEPVWPHLGCQSWWRSCSSKGKGQACVRALH